MWLTAYRLFTRVMKYPPGRARYFARMRVDKDLAAARG